MARYKFRCVNEHCDRCGIDFVTQFPMADVGKTELYPKCEECDIPMEKVFEVNGNFKLKGNGWFKSDGGYGGYTHDVRGNPLGDSIQIGKNWSDRD